MPKHDTTHFDNYSAQNEAKHKILEKYLKAYLTALKEKADWFHYIDGFAGAGTYGEDKPGSPFIALRELKNTGLIGRSVISLVEKNRNHFNSLENHLKAHPLSQKLAKQPQVKNGSFPAFIDEILDYPPGTSATFSFIDPCGLDGLVLESITRILQRPYGEVLLFFNFDAVNRLIGGIAKGTHSPDVLIRLFGTQDRVAELVNFVKDNLKKTDLKEIVIRNALIDAIKERSKIKFFIPFKFQAPEQKRTSHYLIHCSGHRLGFKIMKDVMRSVADDGTGSGELVFLNDKERGKQFKMYNFEFDEQMPKILDALINGPKKVSHFSKDWVFKPTDMFSERCYKKILKELESDGRILIYDKNNKEPFPAEKRNRRNPGSLGDDCWVHLVKSN